MAELQMARGRGKACIRIKSPGELPVVEQKLSDSIVADIPEDEQKLSPKSDLDMREFGKVKESCILEKELPELTISDSIVVDNNWDENLPEDEPRSPESSWVISIKEKLKQADQDNKACSLETLSIYRIPHYLKDGEDKAYIPHTVSLGPYHHGKKRFRQMDRHKWRCLYRILSRTGHEISLYLDSVKEVEEKTRACYEGTISMSSNEFVEMMVLDGCFVIELFWAFAVGFSKLGYPHNDPLFSFEGLMHMILRDMIMLENQIPLFLLDRLFCLQYGQQPVQTGLLAKLAFQFFYRLAPTDHPFDRLSYNRLEFDPLPDNGKLPCLELFRRGLLQPRRDRTQGSSQMQQQLIHCVTELRKNGIKFSKGDTDKFWDIQFEHGTLKIPQLLIDDGTRSIFLNLIAFEQRHFNCDNDITAYVSFMDNLINSPEDVGHLHDCGIIEHWLGSDAEVADLFNQLCKEVVFDINNSYLSKLSEDVNTYSGNRCNGWMASLKLEYFSNPWSIISLIAAFILLVLTFAQTFYGVYGYYRPGS